MALEKWWTPAEEERARRARWTVEYVHGWLWYSPWRDGSLGANERLRVASAPPPAWWDRRGRLHLFDAAPGALTAILDGCGEAP